ncbi:MAG: hypothetical protein PGN16_03735 [Sphingomonas phyllosphaerae]|uniref:hypothetical protein n=1 Tax=Sphingomonas phyllosphaerae TaxID=257003 RepID=UPI002FFB8AE5
MIVGTLLRANTTLIEIIPEEWIKIAELPEDAPMDAILIRSVSLIERQFLSVGSVYQCSERVSVAVRTSKYRPQEAILRLVRQSCHGFTGALLDATAISIRTDGRGPDLRGPGGSFEKTQDFRVAYTVPA